MGSGVTKGPADRDVRRGGGAQSQGGTKSSFECGTIWKNLTKVLAKPCILLQKHIFQRFYRRILLNHLICSILGRGTKREGALTGGHIFSGGGGGRHKQATLRHCIWDWSLSLSLSLFINRRLSSSSECPGRHTLDMSQSMPTCLGRSRCSLGRVLKYTPSPSKIPGNCNCCVTRWFHHGIMKILENMALVWCGCAGIRSFCKKYSFIFRLNRSLTNFVDNRHGC